MEKLTIGQLVDYCIEYNDMYTQDGEKEEQKVRIAGQTDFDNF